MTSSSLYHETMIQLWECQEVPRAVEGGFHVISVHMSGCQVIEIQVTIGSKPSPRATRVEA